METTGQKLTKADFEESLRWVLSTKLVKELMVPKILVGKLTLKEMSNQEEELYVDIKNLIDLEDFVYLTEAQYKLITEE